MGAGAERAEDGAPGGSALSLSHCPAIFRVLYGVLIDSKMGDRGEERPLRFCLCGDERAASQDQAEGRSVHGLPLLALCFRPGRDTIAA